MACEAANTSGVGVDDICIVVGYIDHLKCDILAALELDKVLFSVNDLDLTCWGYEPNVSCVEPPVLVKVLCSFVRKLVITRSNGQAFDPDFATATARIPEVILIRAEVRLARGVAKLWLGVQGNLDGGQGCAHRPDAGIQGALDRGASAGLGEPVTLHQRARESRPDPFLDFAGNGAAARECKLHAAAKHGLKLLEDQKVEQRSVPVLTDRYFFHLHGQLEKEGHHRSAFLNLHLRTFFDRLPNLGHAGHQRRLELLQATQRVAPLGTCKQGLGIGVAHAVAGRIEVQLCSDRQNVG
mmetsp:Transcript_64342/g.153608  ORF Transcript_64342/g.153608 Transcript_64342/m.153608 type:complete len:297 (+) Transcript_64342:410-1300(+)